jgi:predicted DNA-binding transcriptional regulator AlpA
MISEKQLLQIVPIARSTLQSWVRDGQFPKPVAVGPARKMWFQDEIAAWQEAKAATRQ